MKETLYEFYDRIYFNHHKSYALVWGSKAFKEQIRPPNNKAAHSTKDIENQFRPAKWSSEKAQNYIRYLEQQDD